MPGPFCSVPGCLEYAEGTVLLAYAKEWRRYLCTEHLLPVRLALLDLLKDPDAARAGSTGQAVTQAYTDEWLTIHGGDCRAVLAGLPASSVDCVVTSPPYWGLRDYGTTTWTGGDPTCEHRPPVARRDTRPLGMLHGGTEHIEAATIYRGDCGACGAVRIDEQLGLEATPQAYVDHMVAVFAEVRRVLKPTGTCWLNLGDTYSQGAMTGQAGPNSILTSQIQSDRGTLPARRAADYGMKPKDLVGIPWRVAFALQADGWYLRADVIWAKPNPMPESITDRPTKAHEYVFLLTKSPRYYFDADAVREEAAGGRTVFGNGGAKVNDNPDRNDGARQDWSIATSRNVRSVWTIATRPYPGAHFAVFPPELPERCIAAGSSEKGVCPDCGKPWTPIMERVSGGDWNAHKSPEQKLMMGNGTGATVDQDRIDHPPKKVGWQAPCAHGLDPVPAVVLDPFGGSGTVGMVANHLSRRAVLIDLNPAYLRQQLIRNAQLPLGLHA